MFHISRRFWKEERAQDLIEYSMLVAAVALVASGLMLNAGDGVKGIWKSGDNQLEAANTTSSGNQAPAPTGRGKGGNNNGNGHDGGHHGF